MKSRRLIREHAALILAIAACSTALNSVGTYGASLHLGIDPDGPENDLASAAFAVAYEAWHGKIRRTQRPTWVFAEAEAMLRSGWRWRSSSRGPHA